MRRWLLLIVAIPAAGCADLIVHKVPVERRASGRDLHVEGFRYYLSRPYVAVNAPVEVSHVESLVTIKDGCAVTFLNGSGAGKTILLDQLTTTNAGTGAVQPVSQAELEAMRSLIKSRVSPASPRTDPAVRPASLARPEPNYAVTGQPTLPIGAQPEAITPVVQAAAPTPEPPAKDRHSGALNGNIQIVFLPDLDEQYAVENRNFVSKSSFTLKFHEGWALNDVYADHDSTPVPLELLNTIDQAIESAKSVALAQMKQDATGGGGTGSRQYGPTDRTVTVANDMPIYKLVQTTYIKPGLYRLNKPWETGEPMPAGCGFLAKLGLETIITVELKQVTKPKTGE